MESYFENILFVIFAVNLLMLRISVRKMSTLTVGPQIIPILYRQLQRAQIHSSKECSLSSISIRNISMKLQIMRTHSMVICISTIHSMLSPVGHTINQSRTITMKIITGDFTVQYFRKKFKLCS